MSFNWNLADVYSLDYAGVMVFGRKITEVKCDSYHTVTRVHAVNMTSLLMLILIT